MCRCSDLGISPVGQRRDRLTERQPADQIRGLVFIRTKVADRRKPGPAQPIDSLRACHWRGRGFVYFGPALRLRE
jgi:hypothetical protein